MNILDITLIEKTAVESGWENVLQSTSGSIILGSSRHALQVQITKEISTGKWLVVMPGELIVQEITRSFPKLFHNGNSFGVANHEELAQLLYRSAKLSVSLPNQAATIYEKRVQQELATISSFNSEVERVVKQRVGQDTFRNALLDYWGGACSVTGINLPEILRASHIKPWADCCSDEERLNVFNGFLLTANIDALFDKGFVTFTETGTLLCSKLLDTEKRTELKLDDHLGLRWITGNHKEFLAFHRQKIFRT